jgi:AhpD family alkylhydroperoxidase
MERISFGEYPDGLIQAMRTVQTYIDNSGLDPLLLELMCTRVSQINGCAYCLDMHYKDAVLAGEQPLRLISLPAWRETPYYSPAERAVLAFAERLTRMPEGDSGEGMHDALLEHFSKQQIAILSLAIAQINSWNRLMKSFNPVAGNYVAGSKRKH